MKFTCTVDIDAPLETVIALYNNPENLGEWQDGFLRVEHISGTPGKAGAKSRMLYKQGKGEMELIETLLVNDLPAEKTGIYTHKHMENRMTNRFTALGEARTRYTAAIEYTTFNGFIIKLMARLMPGLAKRQVQKWLDQFKAFVEREAARA